MDREELFLNALDKSIAALDRAPFMFPLESVIRQLTYLIEVEKGLAPKDQLLTFDLGSIAARDIDQFDDELASLLHKVSAEVDKIIRE